MQARIHLLSLEIRSHSLWSTNPAYKTGVSASMLFIKLAGVLYAAAVAKDPNIQCKRAIYQINIKVFFVLALGFIVAEF